MCLLQPSLPSAAGFSAAAHLGCVQPLCSLPGAAQRKEAAPSGSAFPKPEDMKIWKINCGAWKKISSCLVYWEKKYQGYLIQEAPSHVKFKTVTELYKNSEEHNH